MILRLQDAARRRLARGEDDGFALVFVLLVTMLIMVGVGTMLTVVAGNILPAEHSQDSETALAAAQAGIEDYVGFLNAHCRTFDTTSCTSVSADPVDGTVGGADGAGTATYERTVLNAASYTDDGFLRVQSTGHAASGTRTLVADLQAVPSFLRFAYYSKYETLSGNYLDSYLPSGRSIAMTSSDAKSLAGGSGSVTWSADPNDDTSICDQLYYASGDGAGRESMKLARAGLPTGTDFAQTSAAGTLYEPCEVTFNSDMSFNGPVYTHDAPYLSYGNNGSTSGPTFIVPTNEDLPPVSTGWTGASSLHYRTFPIIGGGPSSSSTGYATNSTVQYRNYPIELPASVDASKLGTPCIFVGPTRVLLSGSTATVTSPATTGAQTGADPSCYTHQNAAGQYLVDYTSAGGGVIYVANQSGSDPSKYTGQTPSATASSANTAFYLSNGAPATSPDPASAVPTVFTQAGANSSTWQVYNPSNNCWAVSRNPNTPNGPKPWEEQTFQCDWFNQMSNKDYTPASPPNDGYTAYQTALAADLAKTSSLTIAGNSGNSVSYSVNGSSAQTKSVDCSSAADTTFVPVSASADQLVCLVQHDLRQANTGSNEANWANPAQSNYTHQYVVNGYTQTSSTQHNVAVGSTPSLDVGGDKFFDSTTQAGTSSTEDATTTTTTFNVASQVYTCYLYTSILLTTPSGKIDATGSKCGGLLPTGKWAWGDGYYPTQSSPQFQVTVQQKTYSNFQQGTKAAAYFPEMNDVTQYHSSASGMGDAYVEGTGIAGKLSLIAQNDVVVTGALTADQTQDTPSGDEPRWASGGAVDLVADGNVRIYHPVACASSTLGLTTAGFCPNDVTGLYDQTNPPTTILAADGSLGTDHPSLQYCDMTPNTSTQNSACSGTSTTGSGAVSQIDAAVFALGSSFLTDNYDRGVGIGAVDVTGGVYQAHRGATGEKWSSPATVNGKPPYAGYVLSIDYLNLLPANLPYVPSTGTSDGSDVWSVVSTSSATPGGGS